METVFLLYITDRDLDVHLEGIYRTRLVATQKAEFIREWDLTIKDHEILEEHVRESAED